MITTININQLQGHPKNPRKDVGDVTELANSIKEQGVLQNLTVVKTDNEMYTVIIGHRRLEASRLAGLTEMPCTIAEIDEMTQVSTMLVENMQRVDLTPLEQAQGIQQCLDLGMSDTEISKKTGFSKSTIRNRKELLKLNTEHVKQAETLTMDDFISLNRIEDDKLRDELLAEYGGTNEFRIEVESAYNEQLEQKRLEIVHKRLIELEFVQVDSRDWNKHQFVMNLDTDDDEELQNTLSLIDKLDKNVNYEYAISKWHSQIFAIKSETKTNKDSKADEERKEFERISRRTRKELKVIFTSAYQLRHDFMKGIVKGKLSEAMIKHTNSTIAENMLNRHRDFTTRQDTIQDFMGYKLYTEEQGEYYNEYKVTDRAIKDVKSIRAHNIMVASIYLSLDHDELNCYGHQGEYSEYNSRHLKYIYDFLAGFGYVISDVEKKLLDGTHKNYRNNLSEE
ncbi:ParB/RepB/Spo0J family partition protein [Erysipelothrix anatis]|uniref:ParB/RepB/Spo0J family partition protein n=1 Tax=Erysipelothrix anatis TaxID=2683713 RepID=UPI001409F55F|nr:ParB/RepB/Spo0J family partition protein [Erysipelothrix anatis]